MSQIKIAVVMTCYNRKDTTLHCLDRLMNQTDVEDIYLRVYLVDDGCTDGTGSAVRELFPEVIVIRSDGNLFWCGGMRLAFGESLKKDFEYYLWLNDDSMLSPNAVKTLLDTSNLLRKKTSKENIVVGSLCDADSGKRTYGGLKRKKSSLWRPMSLFPVEPSANEPKPCDVINGNCVLIPRKIAKAIGNLSAEFKHSAGDFDYGLRASSQGFSSWITPGYVGTCSRFYFKKLHKDKTLSIKERIDKMSSPAAIMRTSDSMQLVRRHGGFFWPILWLRTMGRNFQQLLWLRIHSGRSFIRRF